MVEKWVLGRSHQGETYEWRHSCCGRRSRVIRYLRWRNMSTQRSNLDGVRGGGTRRINRAFHLKSPRPFFSYAHRRVCNRPRFSRIPSSRRSQTASLGHPFRGWLVSTRGARHANVCDLRLRSPKSVLSVSLPRKVQPADAYTKQSGSGRYRFGGKDPTTYEGRRSLLSGLLTAAVDPSARPFARVHDGGRGHTDSMVQLSVNRGVLDLIRKAFVCTGRLPHALSCKNTRPPTKPVPTRIPTRRTYDGELGNSLPILSNNDHEACASVIHHKHRDNAQHHLPHESPAIRRYLISFLGIVVGTLFGRTEVQSCS